TLTAEVSSLNTALELRSTEIRELRQKNSKLQLEAEIIPVLESEKKKLELRVEDLQQIIENRKNTEKLLTSRCEELQRSANKKAEMSQSVLMENDMLRYRLEEMETSASEGEGVGPMLSSTMWYTPQMSSSQNYSRTLPVSAGRRSRSSHSSDTGAKEGEASALPPAAAAAPSSHNAALMTRSMEGDDVMSQSLVSVYKQQGRERRSRILDDDTICTPEGVYHASELEAAVNGGHRIRMKARLSFDDNDASSSARSPTKGVADSGIFSSIHSQRTADNDDEASS
uniref:Uncharacterized protein n=1 Tax=Plectus sambesii TaxID=2011161 RepID=A0A914XJ17_9BILA